GMAMALARLHEAPRDPRSVRAELPRALCELVLRCLARSPDERFQTADALGEAILAERPSGPDLADYLKSSVKAARGGLALGAPIRLTPTEHPEVLDTQAVASQPPLPLVDALPASRQLPVAVLMFRHAEPEDEYLAHGLTEEII